MLLREEFIKRGEQARGPHEEASGLVKRWEEELGEGMGHRLHWVSTKKARRDWVASLGLAGLSGSSGLWGIEAILG